MKHNDLERSFFYGLGLVILAAFLWGISGGVAGLLITNGWNPIVIAIMLGFFGLIFMFLWLIFSKNKKKEINLSFILWSIVAGIGIAGNLVFYFTSISYTNVAVAATLMYTAPIFVILISVLFKMEKVTFQKIMALLLISLGIILLTGVYKTDITAVNSFGIISGILSSLSYAVFIFAFKYISDKGNTLISLNIAFTVEILLLSIFVDKQQLVHALVSNNDLILFILLGFIGVGLSFFFYVMGLKSVSPGIASIIAMVEPVTASLFGVIVLGQFLTSMQTIGMMVILVTITLLSYKYSS